MIWMGFPLNDDNALFERLVLEINQAGLSWITVLKKKDNFQRAYDGFDVDKVAAYGEADRARLLAEAGIIPASRDYPQPAESECRHRERTTHPVAAGGVRLVQGLAGGPPPAEQRRMDKAIQEDLFVHRRGDRGGVPAQHRLPARCTRCGLSCVSRNPKIKASEDAITETLWRL